MSAGNAVNSSTEISFVDDAAKKGRRDWLILVSISLVIATVLRLIRLGYREFYGNEFLTLNILNGGGPDFFLSRSLEGSISIYHNFLAAWTGLFGVTTETILRIPSVIFGLVACVIFFLFSHRYLRGTALAICLLIFAMNPVLVATSMDASPYAMLAMFVTVAHYFAIRSLDKGGFANWAIYALSVIGGALTHPIFLFILPAHFIFALLRARRTPKAFTIISIFGLVALVALSIVTSAYVEKHMPQKISVQSPSSSDVARGLVSVALGDISRYDSGSSNDFVRGVMYLFVAICILLSVQYYRKRTEEAMAMPENVVWIDETQDVVGTWNRLSLRAFLLFQWFAFVIPLVGLTCLGAIVPGFRLAPELLIIILPALAVLMAMGIDAAPREGALALGVLLLLVMVYYDMRVLTDTGYGVRRAMTIVKEQKFDPQNDLLVYTQPNSISKSIALYEGDFKAQPILGFSNRKDFQLRQAELATMAADYDRIFVIYHDDRKNLGKTEERSPVREWFKEDGEAIFAEADDWKDLSDTEGTELRVYKRLAPGEQPEG